MQKMSCVKFTFVMIIGIFIGATFVRIDIEPIKNIDMKNFKVAKTLKKLFSKYNYIENKAVFVRRNKKVLSFSMFGVSKRRQYTKKLMDIILETSRSKFYQDWVIRVYYEFIPKKKLKKLTTKEQLELIPVNSLKKITLELVNATIHNLSHLNGRTWRFLALADKNADIVCSRDLDSPLYGREESAVKQWVGSGKLMHVMRDNPKHSAHILGGTWCFRSSLNRTLAQEILKDIFSHVAGRNSTSEAYYQNDQQLLRKYMWPKVKHDVMQHDSYLCKRYPNSIPFPLQRTLTGLFVGCKRPCGKKADICPERCRPKKHKDWIYC